MFLGLDMGLYIECCAPAGLCGTPRIERQETATIPKSKRLTIHIRQPMYARYIAGGGPIKTTMRERPPFTTVMYRECNVIILD